MSMWKINKADAYGGILLTRNGQILLREPTNHYDNYVWTYAKGKPGKGDSPEETALREVREETGYAAEIIGVLSGVFKSGNSSTAFFIMRHIGPQGRPDWETQATRWVSFAEAEKLIGKTTKIQGRERDLAVLVAARHWFEENDSVVLPDGERDKSPAATSADWNIWPMPEQQVKLALDFTLNEKEAARIRLGFIPTAMEEKWFSYFENNVLHNHRSWTGFCIDQIHFVPADAGLRATQAVVNRDREQYHETDDAADIRRIEIMVRELGGMPAPDDEREKSQADSNIGGLALAMQLNYLGSSTVVAEVLQPFFELYVQNAGQSVNWNKKQEENKRICNIMSEDGHGYTRMPGWHTESGLGASLIKAFNLDADYCAGENLHFLVSEALAALGLALGELLEKLVANLPGESGTKDDNPEDHEWDPRDRLPALFRFAVSVFLGTNTVAFSGKTLRDMVEWEEPVSVDKPTPFEKLLAELKALENTQRQPPFRFEMVGITPGAQLHFKFDAAKTCEVVTDNKVNLEGKVMSLSAAARQLLQAMGRKAASARGPDYWLYEGKSLTDWRNEKVGLDE